MTWSKQFKPWKSPTVHGSILVVDALTHCALLQSKCDLKAVQKNMQYSLIWELILYKFQLDHDTMEATKNICYTKDNGTVNYFTITRLFKKFCWGCKNLNNQSKLDCETVLQAIEANLANSTQRVQCGLPCLMLTKYCKTTNLLLVLVYPMIH